MKKLLTCLSLILLCGAVFKVHAQDPHFSQFYSNSIYTNPAFTATAGYTKVYLNGRKQFTNVSHSTYTTTAAADMNIRRTSSGLGFICMYDQTGASAYTTTAASAIYSYHLSVSRKLSFSAAIQGGIVNRSINRNNLVFADQLETELGIVRNTDENIATSQRFYPNFSTGFLLYSRNFFAGIAIHNLAEPNQSFVNTTSRAKENLHLRRYTLHCGMNFYTNKYDKHSTIISPNMLCMMQGRASELNLGLYARKVKFTSGVWLRQTMNNSDAMIFMMGYKFDKLSIGYSYDMGIGTFSSNIKSGHEVSLLFDLKKKGTGLKLNTIRHLRIPCPNL
jgi:type IX secretion system PorP/SprF family membrane protein